MYKISSKLKKLGGKIGKETECHMRIVDEETFTSESEKEEKYKMTVKHKRNLSRGNTHGTWKVQKLGK